MAVMIALEPASPTWRGMVAVSNAFRDAGYEVIYGGNMLPPEIATTAVQEDVDIVGLSILSSNYMRLVSETMSELKTRGKGDVMVLVGGMIWKKDFATLKEIGVEGIFIPGTPLPDIVNFVHQRISQLKTKVT